MTLSIVATIAEQTQHLQRTRITTATVMLTQVEDLIGHFTDTLVKAPSGSREN